MPCGDLSIRSKIVVVTGGGSGINLAFVKLALSSGARGIILADLKLTEDAQNVVDKFEQVIFTKCDVSKRKDLEALITTSMERFGEVPDIYIAGAGVFEPDWSNWWADTEEDGYAELEINVNHALKLSRIAVRALLANKKKGVILIVASLAGFAGVLGAPLYCASKHAVIGFVRSMAELDRLEGIKVVAVAPGLVHTPLWTDRPNTMLQFGYDQRGAVTPEFVAEKMLDLVERSEYPGGACLEVSKADVRVLGTWNIPKPDYYNKQIPQDIRDNIYAPLKAFIEKDRQQTA